LRIALETLTHGAAYARHLVRGNHLPGEMAWSVPGAPPVLLAHGFLGTRGTMVPLRKRFEQDGRVVFTYHHGTFQLRSLRASAQELVTQLEQLEQNLGCTRFDVVGFSMGGLIALHAVKFLQAHRWIRRLALLGTPTNGTWTSLLGVATIGLLSPSVWQCLPTSEFLDDLREAPLPPGVRVRQIHASHDALCPRCPPIPGLDADHDYVVLPGGHSSLVVSRTFYLALREFFDAPEPSYAASQDEAAAE
jgi:pimeloyl-ACP methyl ester carboxylesterase